MRSRLPDQLVFVGMTNRARAVLGESDDRIRAAFDRQAACIEADVIVERLAPFAAGEVLIVRLAAFILIAQTLVDAFVALAVFGQNSLLAAFFIRPDEAAQYAGFIAQQEVGAAADDDTVSLFGQIQDDFGLRFKQLFVEVEAEAAAGEHGHEAVLLFAVLFDELFSESALRGDLFDQVPVVEVIAEFCGDQSADSTAARSEFSGNGNDVCSHTYLFPDPVGS